LKKTIYLHFQIKFKLEIMTENTQKQYNAPQVERIELDNEIALQLESTPPKAPGETYLQTPEYLSNDPFKGNLG